MSEQFQCFFANLIEQFYKHGNIHYMLFYGISGSEIEEKLDHALESAEIKYWLNDYLSNNNYINYYGVFKQFIFDFYELNPEKCELIDLYENKRKANLLKQVEVDLEANDYSLYSGNQIIEKLVQAYDKDPYKDKSSIEWIAPLDISKLTSESYYIVDNKIFNDAHVEPHVFSKEAINQLVIEKENHNFYITPYFLPLYLDGLIVTKRGIESNKGVSDTLIEVNYYQNAENYTQHHSNENVGQTYRKLFENDVNPLNPFVELIIDDLGEYYINSLALRTEKDIINFVNLAYTGEEVDREVKSFNRKKILQTILDFNEASQSKVPNKSIHHLY